MQTLYFALLFLFLLSCNSPGDKQPATKPANAEPDGPHLEYFEDSTLKVKGAYKNGVPDGEYTIYFHDGKIDKQMFFANGKKQGLVKVYYPNGQLKHQTYYTDGSVDGESTAYYPDGKKKIFTVVKNHKTLYSVKYDKNGDQVAFDREITFTPEKVTLKLGEAFRDTIFVYTLPTERCTVYVYEKNMINAADSLHYTLQSFQNTVYLNATMGDKIDAEPIKPKTLSPVNGTVVYEFKPPAVGTYKLFALCVVLPLGTTTITSSNHDLYFEVVK